MYLIKCGCGCFFTVKDLSHQDLTCQNCWKNIHLRRYTNFGESERIEYDSSVLFRVSPDDAEISITFNA